MWTKIIIFLSGWALGFYTEVVRSFLMEEEEHETIRR